MDTGFLPVLPVEIFGQIIEQVAADQKAIYKRLATLRSCRSVCHTLDEIVSPYLYRNIPLNGPHSFAKFLNELRAFPERGQLVRTLDFSGFTSVGLGRSRSCNNRILLLTAVTLNECLHLCPNLQEVFLSEALESDIDENVLRTLFIDLKHLKALDFCASDSAEFVQSFQDFLAKQNAWSSQLRHLGLHNCSTLPISFFESLLPHFTSLVRLDLYNTQVSGAGLLSLPQSCPLEVLTLSQCTRITAADLLSFVTTHASSTSLKALSLLYSWNKTHPLSSVPQALDVFVQCLPRTLQILDLAGVELDLQHLAYLPSSLVELGVHDIDVSMQHDIEAVASGVAGEEHKPLLPALQYLLLTQNVISSEQKFAGILATLFPNLSIVESPGFNRLAYVSSLSYSKIAGPGRRDWIRRHGKEALGVEANGQQWHPRKCNMSLSDGTPRGIYDYYSYRV
ncbi:protein of unknown function [Taphrina deformans PYCC 5710]|uniref:F-box domain-containing protein n=1 Tax=Taphrina deformans (strain PYCC 5710 / ATCC 11124 / CBS 356.35 / IMI 108563 / JCM 9778 / NBRC 8474) TaxID=1097556 RepID=R4XE77_TAPDE|nr:protein of unknown function [Taphrina deformans PYCC 5710]|eukprot:CCG83972.1 protein of unknown function [Taphrina deformans PYCC 5710]